MRIKYWLVYREGSGQPERVFVMNSQKLLGAKREALKLVRDGYRDGSGELYAENPGNSSSLPIFGIGPGSKHLTWTI